MRPQAWQDSRGHDHHGRHDDRRDDRRHDRRDEHDGRHGDHDDVLQSHRDGAWRIRLDGGDDSTVRWNLDGSGNWYDFVVTCDADAAFHRRFAGRVETGRHAVSDPGMGRADRF